MATRSGPFYSAFLDANVIRGMATTDAILTLSEEGMYEVRWSDQALLEARRNRPEGLEEGRFDARVRQMNAAFPDARVQGFEHLSIDVPADSKDQPILVAAMHARATTLVTENGKHFWPGMADDNAMLCMSVSDFLRGALLRDQARVVSALSDRVSNNRRPPHTFSDYLDRIVHIQELSVFARALNQAVPERMRGSDPTSSSSSDRCEAVHQSVGRDDPHLGGVGVRAPSILSVSAGSAVGFRSRIPEQRGLEVRGFMIINR